jgi:enoyl-CoA hydratase
MSDTLIVERRGPVEWITFNRPERLNAITHELADAFADRVAALQDDTSARVVVLRGAGRGFCAGLDIKARSEDPDGSQSERGRGIDRLSEIVLGLRAIPQPVVALVHGPACGGGFAFALAADIRIAGESARMNDAFVTLGISGCELGLSYFLPRHVGTSVAAELMYTGAFIDAERALSVGLVSRVVPDADLESAADELIGRMLRVAPLALRKTKETLRKALDLHDLAEVIDIELKTQLECSRGPDFEEGMRAFIEKRPPNFTGA